MATLHETFLDIAQILDDETDKDLLKETLSHPNYDFETLVKVGSSQLVLPTIYCKLKEWNLLDCLPSELIDYLEELTSINRNRNTTLLSEVKEISTIFQKEGIKHSFLKGSALLAAGYYKDKGERMIGDIDVLVDTSQLEQARLLLLNGGYKSITVAFGEKYFDNKHLPRLIPKTKLAAVEIHRKLLHKDLRNQLKPKDYLKESKKINGVFVGSQAYLYWHCILNFQINDYGYYFNYLGLRNAYDALILQKKISNTNLLQFYTYKYVKSFLYKLDVYFSLKKTYSKSFYDNLKISFFKKKQKRTFLRTYWFIILNTIKEIHLILNRLVVFIFNSSYRKESLKDRKRLFREIRNRLNPNRSQ